jgi:hypothetical protein
VGLGKTLEAAENFELVDRLGGATPASLNLLGDIYVNQTAYDLAARSYARAIEADTSGDPARPIRANALPQAELLLGRIEELLGERRRTPTTSRRWRASWPTSRATRRCCTAVATTTTTAARSSTSRSATAVESWASTTS